MRSITLVVLSTICGLAMIDHPVALDNLDPERRYTIDDVDKIGSYEVTGESVTHKGIDVEFVRNRDSVLIFIDAVE